MGDIFTQDTSLHIGCKLFVQGFHFHRVFGQLIVTQDRQGADMRVFVPGYIIFDEFTGLGIAGCIVLRVFRKQGLIRIE